jgi:hypothetical protein
MATFEDAQRMQRLYPDTFAAPGQAELDSVEAGSYVKVCVEGERFWVAVTAVDGDSVTGHVSNDLQRTDVHGLRDGDDVTFEKCHIYDVQDDEADQRLAATPFPHEEGEAMCQHIASEFHAWGGKADPAVAAELVKEFYAWVAEHPEISPPGVMVMQMRISHLSQRH